MKTKYTFLFLFFSLLLTAVQSQHVAKHILVKLKNEIDWKWTDISLPKEVQQDWVEMQGSFPIQSLSHPFHTRSTELDRTYLLVLENDKDVIACMRHLSQFPYIDYAELEPLYSIDYTPNDYIASTQYYIDKLQGELAWNLTKGDTNIVIAIVDVAVMTDHVDLAANMYHNWAEVHGLAGVDDDANGYIDDVMGWDAADWDNNSYPPQISGFNHGTHVAGCASAVADNGIGVAGLGYKCKILPVKAKQDTSSGAGLSATLPAFDYAVSSDIPRIINMSLGGFGSYSTTWQNLVNAAYNKGMVVVASAGNDNALSDTYYPASYNHVISVAASDDLDKKTWFSNYGTKIDVTAPGVLIKSTTVNGVNPPISGYQSWDGTSMSSPIVAGVIALMLSANPALSPDAVEACLKQSCDNIDASNPNYVGKLGAGRVNAFQALTCVIPTVAPIAAFQTSLVDSCGGIIAFTDNSQNLVTSSFWDFGNGQVSTQMNPSYAFQTSGTYTITHIVGNAIGNDTITSSISVFAFPAPIVDAGAGIVGCYGQEVNLVGTSSLSGTILWTPSLGLTHNDSLHTSLHLTQSGVFTLTVITADGCMATDTLLVVTHNSPTVYAGADQTINPGASVQLNALGANNLSYLWSPAATLSDPTIKNPIATPTITTLYTLTVTNIEGCSKSDEVIVYVNGTIDIDPKIGINIYPPFPNPTENGVELHADFLEKSILSLTACDVMGRKISDLYQGEITDNNFSYFWEMNLPTGIYFVHWNIKNSTFVQKVIKQ